MFLQIEGLFSPQDVAKLTELAGKVPFEHGRATNPAITTKDNLQAQRDGAAYNESVRIAVEAFQRSRAFMDFAFPKRIAPPLLTRYEPGMKYGAHADAAFMNSAQGGLRSDISCTVFLSDPSTYEGGELLVHLGTQPVGFKGPPGSAVVYPSTLLHEVLPVRSGVRLVAITFVESMIPQEGQRTTLYEISDVLALEANKIGWDSRVRLEVVRNNLMRMWSL
jgi:PKHD-type hydroxylase